MEWRYTNMSTRYVTPGSPLNTPERAKSYFSMALRVIHAFMFGGLFHRRGRDVRHRHAAVGSPGSTPRTRGAARGSRGIVTSGMRSVTLHRNIAPARTPQSAASRGGAPAPQGSRPGSRVVHAAGCGGDDRDVTSFYVECDDGNLDVMSFYVECMMTISMT